MFVACVLWPSTSNQKRTHYEYDDELGVPAENVSADYLISTISQVISLRDAGEEFDESKQVEML